MNTLMRRFAAVSLGVVLFGGGMAPALALTPNIGSATAAKEVVKPAKLTVTPVPVEPAENEDGVIQLNALRITDVSGNVISAVTPGIQCFRAPCPQPPTQLYKIEINPYTILLFRNRTRATLSDFAVGDRMNVYGFRSGNTMTAFIARDLDKPEIPQPIDLMNMEITAMSGNSITVQLHMYCKDGMICPMGAAESSTRMMPMFYPMPRTILIDSATRFTNKNGVAIKFGDLRIGDRVNVSGTMQGKEVNAPITAKKIQDISIPRSSGTLSVQSLSGPGKLSLGEMGEWKISVNGGNQKNLSYQISWGDEYQLGMNKMMMPPYPEDMGSAGIFTHAYENPGTYTVTITVTDANGASARASATVSVYDPQISYPN